MSESQEKFISIVMGALFLISMFFVGKEAARYVMGEHLHIAEKEKCVVIDAGHGSGELRLVKLE